MKRLSWIALLLCAGPVSAQVCVPPPDGGGVKSPQQVWDEKYALAQIQLQYTTGKLAEAKAQLAQTDVAYVIIGGRVNDRLNVMTPAHIQTCLDGLKIAAGCRSFQSAKVAECQTQNSNQSKAIAAAVLANIAGDYAGSLSLLADASYAGELSAGAAIHAKGWADAGAEACAVVWIVVGMYP